MRLLSVVGFGLFFLILFFYFLGNPYPTAIGIQKVWAFSKSAHAGMAPDPRFLWNPEEEINGYKYENSYYTLSSSNGVVFDDIIKIEYPLNTKGYIEYKKIGSEVNFYSPSREILWTKEYRSYPRVSPSGNLVLLIAGDHNQVLLSDINGNTTGAGKIDGRFLTDYTFASVSLITGVLFSGGELFVLDSKGAIQIKKNLGSEKNPVFAKSVSLSPDGSKIAIHLLNTNRDSVIVFGEKGEEIFSFDLDTIYPHKLNLAISNTGEILVSTPNSIEFYDVSGKKILNLKRTSNNGVYQAVYHNGNWFTAELNQEILFIDEVGKILKKEKIRGSDLPVRFFPSGKNASVVLETKKELFLYRNL
ncbi:hypothetical protein GS518_10405 [Leptospira interrogans]|uniref:WD40 repeat domain-containing protein n=2 Tax=Leptospira interrogans TaxID=173 RepID=Q72QL3_LEPIC|nr:hypothetical protein [Leptospira interrogans]APH41918.1 Uncharacterized protein A9P81_2248 [Leptospira interrogans serovar Copenhageni/Icterohaemorrhagiae]OCC30937.1 Uncharacterized protein GNX_0679 [Leptospira interrogans serovar Canicola]AAS70671.1 conserved hypothetical protein [Leptospira interrogans serovar Copenhageni str. Fiocruz L1-130]ARB94845.1 hypothetical protein A6J42_04105 [Leptospira interrogans serovar Copenhageni]EKP23659.1 hypothetical protein LEP1GSC117_3507 [Leptospira i